MADERFVRRACGIVAIALAACSSPPASDMPDSRVVMNDDSGVPACIAPTPPSIAGSICRCTSDCATPGLCQTEDVHGEPMGQCRVACSTAAPCPSGYRCTSDNLCEQTCTAAGQCGSARYCFIGTCTPYCAADTDCFSGHCDPYTGRCTATVTMPTGGQTGDACIADADCRSTHCSTTHTCIELCVLGRASCPGNEGCYSGNPAHTIEAGLCVQNCDGGVTCRDPTTQCTALPELGGGMYCV
jgi:hypothetical protein